jgi:hypothetical protein
VEALEENFIENIFRDEVKRQRISAAFFTIARVSLSAIIHKLPCPFSS